jgi:hypothetical protein
VAEQPDPPAKVLARLVAAVLASMLACPGPASAQAPEPAPAPAPAAASAARPPALESLAQASPAAGRTARGREPVAHCRLGFRHGTDAPRLEPAPLPPAGAVFASGPEVARWRSRVETGPFVREGDFMAGSPGDWERIAKSARAMIMWGEPGWTDRTPGEDRGVHGSRARDAAFFHLLTGEPQALRAVRAYLLREAANPLNDWAATLCIVRPDGVVLDAHLGAASWLLRFMVTYDFVRPRLPAADRAALEHFIARNARFLASHLDYGVGLVFPQRERGDYRTRLSDAAPGPEGARSWMRRYDTNGDCEIDAADRPGPWPAHAYVDAAGQRGPRLSMLSQWYNNRKSGMAAAVGAAGILLDDDVLVASAVRYFMEWLAYGVWPDGSLGEYARNGEYCIPQQGVIYGTLNLQGAALLAAALARQGDRTLLEFSTREGLFGTASQGTDAPKSLALAIRTYVRLVNGELDWYLHEGWKERQEPRPQTRLSGNVFRFMGGGPTEDYHELGLLPVAAWLPDTGVEALVLRDRRATRLRFPGAGGAPVSTGFGQWTDAFNALPAMLLLRP